MTMWRNRNYLILFSGQLVSTVGNNFFIIALPWFVLSITNSKFDLTLAGIVQTLPSLAGLFVGVLVDRWDKRYTMIISDVLRAVMAFLMFFITYLFSDTTVVIFTLLLLVFLHELFGTAFSPAFMSLIPKVVGKENLTKANGISQSGSAFSALSGRAAGGVLITLLSAPMLFLLNSLSFVFSVVSLFFVKTEKSMTKKKKRAFFSEWLQGVRIIYRSKSILGITCGALIANFASSALTIILTVWVQDVLKGTSWMFGIVISVELIGMMIGGVLLSFLTKFLPLRIVTVYAPIFSGGCMALIGAWANLTWAALMLFIIGICVGIFNGSTDSYLMDAVPDEVKGRVFSTGMALARLTVPLGITVFGFFLLYLKLVVIFIICGLILISSGLILFGTIDRNISFGTIKETPTNEQP